MTGIWKVGFRYSLCYFYICLNNIHLYFPIHATIFALYKTLIFPIALPLLVQVAIDDEFLRC